MLEQSQEESGAVQEDGSAGLNELVNDLILQPQPSQTQKKMKESKSVKPRVGQNFKSPPVGSSQMHSDLRDIRLQQNLTNDLRRGERKQHYRNRA